MHTHYFWFYGKLSNFTLYFFMKYIYVSLYLINRSFGFIHGGSFSDNHFYYGDK